MRALIIVDVQNDFCPGGSLAVKQGDSIVAEVNRLIAHHKTNGDLIVYTADAHPSNHSSFKENGGIWPPHCVKDTNGQKFHPNLLQDRDGLIFEKGTDVAIDSYSGFGNPELDATLKRLGVKHVTVVGLALDYCVKATALDAIKNGYFVNLPLKGTRAVNVNPGDDAKAILELREAGVRVYE